MFTDEGKLMALFGIIDDPDAWWEKLSYQQQILCKGWLLTGNRLFADALLQKMLPERVLNRGPVASLESVPHLIMQVS